jgi:hypothetical protein
MVKLSWLDPRLWIVHLTHPFGRLKIAFGYA